MILRVITDHDGEKIGFIELSDGGRQVAKDVHHFPIAYYDPEIDRTIDTAYRVITHGNTLISLLKHETSKGRIVKACKAQSAQHDEGKTETR